MRLLKQIITITIVFCLLAGGMIGVAAAGNLSATRANGQITVTWNADECGSGECTLTVYRNNWPAHIACVSCAQGAYTVPKWASAKAGTYTVRLRCQNSCLTAKVIDAPTPTIKPTAQPTVKPTAAPTVKPTAAPTVKPTAQPTVKPTAAPTVKPTAQPTVKPTPAPSYVPGSSDTSLAQLVISLVNAERAKYGLNALSESAELNRAACVRAGEIVTKFSHTRPDGSSWSTASNAASGENIAKGYATAQAVVTAWMNSQGHRENILRESFTQIGVCAYVSGGTVYWAQLFGR